MYVCERTPSPSIDFPRAHPRPYPASAEEVTSKPFTALDNYNLHQRTTHVGSIQMCTHTSRAADLSVMCESTQKYARGAFRLCTGLCCQQPFDLAEK